MMQFLLDIMWVIGDILQFGGQVILALMLVLFVLSKMGLIGSKDTAADTHKALPHKPTQQLPHQAESTRSRLPRNQNRLP